MGQFVLQSGQTRACLDFTISSDEFFENAESFSGRLRGVVTSPGSVNENPERVTILPRDTTVVIEDNPDDGETLVCTV